MLTSNLLKAEEIIRNFHTADFITEIKATHVWKKYKKTLLGANNGEELVECQKCNLVAKRLAKDKYYPPEYQLFSKPNEIQNCNIRCIVSLIL